MTYIIFIRCKYVYFREEHQKCTFVNRVSRIASTFFLCIMLIGIMKNTMLVAIYEYDTKLFVSLFCENKTRPQLKCDGKCYLAKMLQDKEEREAASTLHQLQTEIPYCTITKTLHVSHHEVSARSEIKQTTYYNTLYSFLYTMRLFKPPITPVLS